MSGKMSLKKSVINIIVLFFSLRAVSDLFLAFASSKYDPLYATLVSLIVYATVPLGIIWLVLQKKVRFDEFKLLVIPLFYWLLLIVNTYKGYRGDWITSLIAICCFLCMNPEMKVKIFRCLYWIIQINNIFSIFMYLCFVFNISIGIEKVSYYFENSLEYGYYYQKWGIFAICSNGQSDRLCGIFNEPGVLGTICALLFIVIFTKSKLWEKVLLLITTLLTFSLAGYLILFLFAALYLIKKNWKNIVWIVFFVIIFFVIPHIDWGNDTLNWVAGRFDVIYILGARTTDQFDYLYNMFLKSESFFWGYGAGYVTNTASLSYKIYIIQFGVIGYFLILVTWIWGALLKSRNNKENWLLMIFFFLSLYQRPGLTFAITGYVILFGGIEWNNLEKGF